MTALKKIFAVACVGTAIPNLDLFSINIALPKIAAEFKDVPLDDLSWILNAYAITYAALLVFLGRLAEGYRRDRSFLLGVGIFSIAAAASAFATSYWELVAYRVVAASGAALMTPTSIGLILATFPLDQRGKAIRGWAGIGGLAAALGPVLGGVLVSIDWRLVFIANAVLGAASLLVGFKYLPCVQGHSVTRPSFIGAALITGGIATLIFAIVKINVLGLGSPLVYGNVIASVVLLGLFLLHLIKSANPLIDPEIFRIRSFFGATLAMIPYSVSFGAMLFSVSVWGQTAWGWSALQAGFAIIPGPLMVPITSKLLTGKLIDRGGVTLPILVGTIFIITGFCIWASFVGVQPNALLIVLGMLFNGVGVGLVFPALMGAGTQNLPSTSFATGSATINMLRQASIAIGVAIFVAIVGSPNSIQDRLTNFQNGWLLLAGITLLTLVLALKFLTGSSLSNKTQ